MFKKELKIRNPLRHLGQGKEELLNGGFFGAVMAPVGVGKTAFLVQLAINSMLEDEKSPARQPGRAGHQSKPLV